MLFCAPYYGWFMERLVQALKSDASVADDAEAPRLERSRPEGSTSDVDYWTSKDVSDALKSHVNYMVADGGLEMKTGNRLGTHSAVHSWVKNAGLGLGIPYVHNGERHDYLPDFIVRLEGPELRYLLLETKGYDELWEVKKSAAERWCAAVTADGRWGEWIYQVAFTMADVAQFLEEVSIGRPAGV